MKIVLIDKETDAILESIHGAEDIEVNGNNVTWNTGSFKGVKSDKIEVLVLEDTEDVPEIVDGVERDKFETQEEKAERGKHKIPKGLKNKGQQEKEKHNKRNDQAEIQQLKKEVAELKELIHTNHDLKEPTE